MQCSRCGSENPNGVSYCVKCGQFLMANNQPPQMSQSSYNPNYPPATPYSGQPPVRNFSTAPAIKYADGEKNVKTYLCTYYRSRLLGLKANGDLIVTNKRVMFHARGSSISGDSIIQSEIPVENVAGLISFKGNSFHIWTFIGFLLVGLIGGSIITGLITAIGYQNYTALMVMGWVFGLAAFAGSFYFSFKQVWRNLLVFLAAACISATGSGSLIRSLSSVFNPFSSVIGNSSGSSFGVFFAMLVSAGFFIYAIVCLVKYSFKPVFSLNVIASNGNSAPISIGNGLVGFASSSASRALTAEPAEDSERVIAELGSLVLDIQKMGDLAIDRWSHS